MPITTEQELSDSTRSLWLKAMQAAELRNFGYAISLLQTVLKEAPGFLPARKTLRRVEIASTKGKKSFLSGLSVNALKAGSVLKKDPFAAMEMAEKTLETDPFNAQANQLLKEAAIAKGLIETAEFALETIAEGSPNDTKVLHELARFYYDNGKADLSVDIYTKITEIAPHDMLAAKMGKDAAARTTMNKGGWEEVAASGGKMDYRDLIKNKDEAVSLEQKSRVVKSEEMIDAQLVELYAQAEKEPNSTDLARRIAALFEQKKDFPSAIWWYQRALELTNNADQSLARKVSDLGLQVLESQIEENQQWLSQYPDADEAAQVRETLEELQKQKAEMLITEARKRVEHNPTDLQFRFELGEQLLKAGHHTEAIPELQKARTNPNVRIKAMGLLGLCYQAKNMLDLAHRQFSEAAKELASMDNVKKDLVYRLGLLNEQMGKKDEALNCFKEIYDVDYGYEDVARRVEESYSA
jgi:tetratricopeptide (TPR) repeat protein